MIYTQVLARHKLWHQICNVVYQNSEIADKEFDRGSKGKRKMVIVYTCIDRYIVSSGAKSEMLNSRSENIRKSAVRSCRIASFCVTFKEALVNEMLENDIEPKPYKVSQFLSEVLNHF